MNVLPFLVLIAIEATILPLAATFIPGVYCGSFSPTHKPSSNKRRQPENSAAAEFLFADDFDLGCFAGGVDGFKDGGKALSLDKA